MWKSDGFGAVRGKSGKVSDLSSRKIWKKRVFSLEWQELCESECFFLWKGLKKQGKMESFGLGYFGNLRVVGKMRVISDSDEKMIEINELLPEKILGGGFWKCN